MAASDKLTQKINGLLSQLTIDEKIALIHGDSPFTTAGIPRLNIPPLTMSDGPNGVKFDFNLKFQRAGKPDDASTYLPVGTALAATWNRDLARAYGQVLGEEALFRGKRVLLGPSLNIIRTPLCGRNFEYFSEDPYLISEIVVPWIEGIQSCSVAACAKHFVANNQEIGRMTIDVIPDERALHEIYLPGFKAAVIRGQVKCVMGAYNKLFGQFCSHNDFLLNKILKEAWQFPGVVISDWGAVHDTTEAALNGCDLEMGSEIGPDKLTYEQFFMAQPLKEKVLAGEISERVIDDKVRRLLRLILETFTEDSQSKASFNTPEHHRIACEIAEEAIVLLKNEASLLPLDFTNMKKLAVIGENADRKHGAGGGAAGILPFYEITPLEGLKKLLPQEVTLLQALGYSSKPTDQSSQLLDEAIRIAREADAVILVGGLNHGTAGKWELDSEMADRPDLKLPYNQDVLIQAVTAANPKTVIVLVSGGAVEMPWLEQVPTVLQMWYAGMEGGTALARVLSGQVSPSGKLPMTFPRQLADCPAHALGEYPGQNGQVKYNEGIWVGYRYYDRFDVDPLFAFGHGLSYTTFSYSDLHIHPASSPKTPVKVTCEVKNSGQYSGKETVQLYLGDVESELERPIKELKAFEKVALAPGATKKVEFFLENEAFSYYHPAKQAWVTEPGRFKIFIGSSSRDIRLEGEMTIN